MAQGAVQLVTRAVFERRAARKFAAKRTHPQVRQLQPMRIQPHSGMQTHACNACSARLKRYFFGLYVSRHQVIVVFVELGCPIQSDRAIRPRRDFRQPPQFANGQSGLERQGAVPGGVPQLSRCLDRRVPEGRGTNCTRVTWISLPAPVAFTPNSPLVSGPPLSIVSGRSPLFFRSASATCPEMCAEVFGSRRFSTDASISNSDTAVDTLAPRTSMRSRPRVMGRLTVNLTGVFRPETAYNGSSEICPW